MQFAKIVQVVSFHLQEVASVHDVRVENLESNNQCILCPSGQYQPRSGQTSCIVCPEGTFRTEQEGSWKSDQCLGCGVGTYLLETNGTECQSCPTGWITLGDKSTECTVCEAGKYALSTKCVDCERGRYSEGPTTSCTMCPEGYYSDEGIAQTSVSTCKSCPAGTYSNNGPGQYSSSTCTWCEAGKYSETVAATDSSFCVACPTGFYQENMKSTECTACGEGKYGTYNPYGSNSELECRPCAAGKYSTAGVGQTDISVCQDCEDGTFALAGSITCTPYTTECPPGEQLQQHNLKTIDRECIQCYVGFYKSTTGPEPCTMGLRECDSVLQYLDQGTPTTDSVCRDCPSGRFDNDRDGSNECESLPCICPNGVATGNCTDEAPIGCETCFYGEHVTDGDGPLELRKDGTCCPNFQDYANADCKYCDDYKCIELTCRNGYSNDDHLISNGCEYKDNCDVWYVDHTKLTCGYGTQAWPEPLSLNTYKFFIDEDKYTQMYDKMVEVPFEFQNKDTLMQIALFVKMHYNENWFGESLARELKDIRSEGMNHRLSDSTIHTAVKECLKESLDGKCPVYGITTTKYGSDMAHWNTYAVSDMSTLFIDFPNFEVDISKWQTDNVIDMTEMFSGNKKFNADIQNWNVIKVKSMKGMFKDSEYSQPLNNWRTDEVEDMSEMFSGSAFNADISSWNTGNLKNMNDMFAYSKFNQDISDWDVSSVTKMVATFKECKDFNNPLGAWDTSKVTDMSEMFTGASAFNQNIRGWDVSNVEKMERMFYDTTFDQPIFSEYKNGQLVTVTEVMTTFDSNDEEIDSKKTVSEYFADVTVKPTIPAIRFNNLAPSMEDYATINLDMDIGFANDKQIKPEHVYAEKESATFVVYNYSDMTVLKYSDPNDLDQIKRVSVEVEYRQVRKQVDDNGNLLFSDSGIPLFDTPQIIESSAKQIEFDGRAYHLCAGESVSVLWNGEHNIYETTEENYNNERIAGGITNVTKYYQSGTIRTLYSLGAIPRKNRYFICQKHPSFKFSTYCLNGNLDENPDFIETKMNVTTTQTFTDDNGPVVLLRKEYSWSGPYPSDDFTIDFIPNKRCESGIDSAYVDNTFYCMKRCVKKWSKSPAMFSENTFQIENLDNDYRMCHCLSKNANCDMDASDGVFEPYVFFGITTDKTTMNSYRADRADKRDKQIVEATYRYKVGDYESDINENAIKFSRHVKVTAVNDILPFWNMHSVKDATGMFEKSAFNQQILGMDFTSMEKTDKMFKDNKQFNQPLSAVILSDVFSKNKSADVDLSGIQSMSSMFEGASEMQYFSTNAINKLAVVNKMFDNTEAIKDFECDQKVAKTHSMQGHCIDTGNSLKKYEGNEDNPGTTEEKNTDVRKRAEKIITLRCTSMKKASAIAKKALLLALTKLCQYQDSIVLISYSQMTYRPVRSHYQMKLFGRPLKNV